MDRSADKLSHTEERRSFIFLAFVMAPVLAVIVVTGYGFFVWMYQLIAGPPTG
ncbi:MAG TPA: periplasmic nitrate reductase, NapE protein [Burkholderiales bacterium]|jgi:periplasmic nitrate reductase NapE|nr:periplasmic nitrate reductase, NapE protein [Burkholderiales bacterium]